ncbi:5'-methylthioadenosine/adenosylhomocysteine nucleosidase [Kiloniella laminariae]|uniref:5'-methylthioadenosine/adenosylhomocysteine nucleosidase n=1 Tax=Kiloniella laminariae TaxID=454162 RepID=UPI000373999B|nr:5'-methylthioadenosine/adenosylhomocysteine nucleosidase [Kiloniella laminariae]
MSEQPLGLICAIPNEIQHFGQAFQLSSEKSVAGFSFLIGKLEGVETVLVEAGMGKVNAAVVTTLLMEHFKCRAILFSGVAGGLDPRLGVGDVVIGSKLVQHDYGMVVDNELTTYQPGHLPIHLPTSELGYDVAASLIERIMVALADFELPEISAAAAGGVARTPVITSGVILTGDQFIGCTASRDRLCAVLGGLAVEMEGAAIAQVAQRYQVPCLVVRSLSDLAGEENTIDFMQFLEETAGGAALVLRRIIPLL